MARQGDSSPEDSRLLLREYLRDRSPFRSFKIWFPPGRPWQFTADGGSALRSRLSTLTCGDAAPLGPGANGQRRKAPTEAVEWRRDLGGRRSRRKLKRHPRRYDFFLAAGATVCCAEEESLLRPKGKGIKDAFCGRRYLLQASSSVRLRVVSFLRTHHRVDRTSLR